MRHLFRKMRRRLGLGTGRKQDSREFQRSCEDLAQAEAETIVTITSNNDHKTVERGLCTGVKIKVLRNELDEPNLIVAVGDARYVLDRRIARRIKIMGIKK